MLCAYSCLTHWSRVTHICVGNLTTIASDNGLSPDRRQAIIWANAGILSIGHLGINFSEISMEIQTFSLWKMRLKSSSAKWRPSCLGFNVLTHWGLKQNWLIFCRRYLQAHFLVWKFSCLKICVFYWNFTEICCLGKPLWSKELLICEYMQEYWVSNSCRHLNAGVVKQVVKQVVQQNATRETIQITSCTNMVFDSPWKQSVAV